MFDSIDPWTARFRTNALESEYRAFIFERDFRNNSMAMAIALPFFGIYALMDFVMLADPRAAIIVRLCVVAACLLLLFLFRLPKLRRHHEDAITVIVAAMGCVIAFIVTQDDSLQSSYYVGLIQGGVFISFLLRLGFLRSLGLLLFLQAAFVAAVVRHPDTQQAAVQSGILATNLATCAFGIYILQIYRRQDFAKTKTIARQNEQLNEMLNDVRLDNARKVAAMNLLVHFVKTPIHQIVGFTDLITNSLESRGADVAFKETVEGARFIKSASRELSQNVTRLLAYYRLDESAAAPAADLIELDPLVRDYSEHFPDRIKVTIAAARVAIVGRQALVNAALGAMVDYYSAPERAPTSIAIALARSGRGAAISIADDLPPLSEEDFQRLTKPLDKLDHYLTANGSSMPMSLRTAARAADLSGGALAWRREANRNVFTLTFADFADRAALGDAA